MKKRTKRTIEQGDIVRAIMEACTDGKLGEIIKEMPSLLLLIPIIGIETEEIIFADSEKED